MTHFAASQAVAVLGRGGVKLEPGLTDQEITAVQQRYGFAFNPDHRALIERVVPSGPRWPDWRDGDLTKVFEWPIHGVCFDVRHDGYWHAEWPDRPDSSDAAEALAAQYVRQWPRLVPVYSHGYAPAAAGSPVLSVHQTDIIYYGPNLIDYLRIELPHEPRDISTLSYEPPYWSEFC
jgi:hypothetical protein